MTGRYIVVSLVWLCKQVNELHTPLFSKKCRKGVTGKMKKTIVISISLLILLGVGVYLFVDYQKKMQEEEERQAVKIVKEAIAGLYVDEERAEFVQDVSEEDFEGIRKEIGKITNEKSIKSFTKDLDDAKVLLKAREKVRGLLEDGVLVEAIDETLLASLAELMTEIKEINDAFAELVNKDVKEIKSQYESLLSTKKEVYALFSDKEHKTMKKEVTREQYEEVKSSIKALLNEKEKNGLQEILGLVNAELTKNEEAEKKRIVAEEKMAALTVGKAKEIGSEILINFLSILGEAGDENGWGVENPGVYAVVKPRLMEVITKGYSEKLSAFVEDYYCECDVPWQPYLSDSMIRYEVLNKTKNSFSIAAISVVDNYFGGPAFKTIYTFEDEGGVWKLDGWKLESLEGENLDLSVDEVISAWSGFGEITDVIEYYFREAGEMVYEIQFESDRAIGISMSSGQMLEID